MLVMTLKSSKICLMSIKPVDYDRILAGHKQVEYRKICPKNHCNIFLYVSSPVRKICGIMKIGKVLTDKVENIWEITNGLSGITEAEYNSYIGTYDYVTALYIKHIKSIPPIDPKNIIDNFFAPQNYIYIRNEKLSALV